MSAERYREALQEIARFEHVAAADRAVNALGQRAREALASVDASRDVRLRALSHLLSELDDKDVPFEEWPLRILDEDICSRCRRHEITDEMIERAALAFAIHRKAHGESNDCIRAALAAALNEPETLC